MDERINEMDIPDEILDCISGGALTGSDKQDLRRYIKWFKKHGDDVRTTQLYWIDHMRQKGIRSYTEDEAKAAIASLWDTV